MMFDADAQVIFLLTYQHSKSEFTPLTAQEYSQLANKIKDAGLPGPRNLLSRSIEEMKEDLGIEAPMAERINKLLGLGGTATLYIENLSNQGIELFTRASPGYPAKLKSLLQNYAPPFICSVGVLDLLETFEDPQIVLADDMIKLTSLKFVNKAQQMICLLNSMRHINQLANGIKSWEKTIVISSLGLRKFIRHPWLRESIQKGDTLVLSTNTVESTSPNYHIFHLLLMAFSLLPKSTVVYPDGRSHAADTIDRIRGLKYLNSRLDMDDHPKTSGKIASLGVRLGSKKQSPGKTLENQDSSIMTIYTIGHSNHEIEKLLDLLRLHKIDLLVDIRTVPSSKFSPQFNKKPLKDKLLKMGIKYKYEGSRLGGRPQEADVLNSEGKIVREYIENMDWYQSGIQELVEIAKTGKRLALMCSEEDPAHCHRGYIVSNTLIDKGIRVLHIRSNGEAQYLGILSSPTDQMEIPL